MEKITPIYTNYTNYTIYTIYTIYTTMFFNTFYYVTTFIVFSSITSLAFVFSLALVIDGFNLIIELKELIEELFS